MASSAERRVSWALTRQEGKESLRVSLQMIPGDGDRGSSRLTKPSFGHGFMGAVGFVITQQCGVEMSEKTEQEYCMVRRGV